MAKRAELLLSERVLVTYKALLSASASVEKQLVSELSLDSEFGHAPREDHWI